MTSARNIRIIGRENGKNVSGRLQTHMENSILSHGIPASHTWLAHTHAMAYQPPTHGWPILMPWGTIITAMAGANGYYDAENRWT